MAGERSNPYEKGSARARLWDKRNKKKAKKKARPKADEGRGSTPGYFGKARKDPTAY